MVRPGCLGSSCDRTRVGYRYGCPLCLKSFTQDQIDLLTFEHVPPRTIGGKPLVLTCRPCNNLAGRMLDHHVSKLADLSSVIRGRPMGKLRARVAIENGLETRADISWSNEGISIANVPKANHPLWLTEQTRILDEVAAGTSPPPTITMRFEDRIDYGATRRSGARSAYLAAFAALGYRYILQAWVKVYRERIFAPSGSKPSLPTFLDPAENVSGRRFMLLAKEPEWVAGLLIVGIDERVLFLPGLEDAPEAEQKLDAFMTSQGQHVKWTARGKGIPWPSGPEFGLDLHETS